MKKTMLLGSLILASQLMAGYVQVSTPVGDAEISVDNSGVSSDIDISSAFGKAKGKCGFDISLDTSLPSDQCSDDNRHCFNAGMDVNINGQVKTVIHTHKAGAQFQLRLRHRHGCGWGWHHHIAVALVDNTTGELITEPKEIDASITSDDVDATFEVDGHAYRNVSVRFFHLHPEKCDFHHGFRWMHQAHVEAENMNGEIKIADLMDKPFVVTNELQCYEVNASNWMDGGEEVACPTNYTELQEIIKSEMPSETSFRECAQNHFRFRYAMPKYNQCYTLDNPCATDANDAYISKSDDSFAIIPAYFTVTLPTTIKANQPASVTVTVKDAKGNVIENYTNSSANLKVTFTDANNQPVDARYAFDIVNGVGKGTVIVSKQVNGLKMNVEDPTFASVDDNDGTPVADRVVTTDTSSSSSSDVTGTSGSKYWAGVGTNVPENDPTKNTINSDIQQNTKKDLHYNKMGW